MEYMKDEILILFNLNSFFRIIPFLDTLTFLLNLLTLCWNVDFSMKNADFRFNLICFKFAFIY